MRVISAARISITRSTPARPPDISPQATSSCVDNIRATLVRMSRFTVYPHRGVGEHAWVEHCAVTEAIRAAEPETAAEAMRTHLTNSLERINAAIA